MDETLSTDERSTLRAAAIGALRAMQAEQESRLPLRPRFYGDVLRTTPAERDQVNRSLDHLRRAGERMYESDYDRSPIMPPSTRGKRPGESTSTNDLVATIKRVLRRIDPGTP